MKQILKLIVAILFVGVAVNSYAAKNEVITLIVTSDGTNKDEAIKNALRSAIEQTYGVFVSASTDILNDEIVSDEIATIASGNVKSYKELSVTQSESKVTVSLEAVVSTGKLISYAKSKGAECELDGASMFADLELQELYKANEEKAIENLVLELTPIFREAFDYEIKLEQRDANYRRYGVSLRGGGIGMPGAYFSTKNDYVFFECNIKAKLNERGETAWKRLLDVMTAIGTKQSRFNSYLNGFQVASTDIQIPAPMGIGNIYSFRSRYSVALIKGLIASIPQIIRNASIYTNLGVIADLSKELEKEYDMLIKEYSERLQEYLKLERAQDVPSVVIERRGMELGELELKIVQFAERCNLDLATFDEARSRVASSVGVTAKDTSDVVDSFDNNSDEASGDLLLGIMEESRPEAKNVNPSEEVSLTVSSDGTTKNEALKNALRTAIEQAYGAFVSANTTILNDELVKDEIVTVSNGSIKDYKEISSFEKPDGSGYMTTVNATVSLPHLITYAKNHGGECEFAGNTFGMELKLFKLQKGNELKALYNMIPVVQELCRTTMLWELEVSDPVIPEIRERYGEVRFDGSHGNNHFGFSVPSEFLSQEMLDGFRNFPQNYCGIKFTIKYRRNGRENEVLKYIYNTLKAIEIPHEMWSKYQEMGFTPGLCSWEWGFAKEVYDLYAPKKFDSHISFHFRNGSDIAKWTAALQDSIDKVRLNFVINDNNGISSDGCFYELCKFMQAGMDERERYKKGTYKLNADYRNYYGLENEITKFIGYSQNSIIGYDGGGLFKWPFCITSRYSKVETDSNLETKYLIEAEIILPLSEIGKYSSFKIVAKE